ncbi:amino acid ABC transporter ATP-binding/permease protein [Chachezhania sediminis]|uniref:amino acid ABC transporter ATP-binding/permease protein n=1 Tax=Chachezhania sediminis TaxID=2599291 RepID=UPI00131A701C|nr:ATP-binding cassette domain-containing protein [Chachezhania sediminis]
MKALVRIVLTLWREERRVFLRGLLLSVLVLAAGAALLGVSGWFITAAAVAGLAGAGQVFDIFRPSAMVRMLALGRTAARYGERLATHDATLRALARLRVRLLVATLQKPFRSLERLRASAALNRLTADIDTLDSVALRLVLPALAGSAAILGAGVALWFLVTPATALVVCGLCLICPTALFLWGQRRAQAPSRRAEAGVQALRSRLVDLIAMREDLIVYGRLADARDSAARAAAWHLSARRRLSRIETGAGLVLDLIGAVAVAAALGLGIQSAQTGEITAAQAAIGVFVALALAEAMAPVARALAEMGRVLQAARRVAPDIAPDPLPVPTGAPLPDMLPLTVDQLRIRRGTAARDLCAPVSLHVAAGETVALTGPSGSGKSTVLLMIAGALSPSGGSIAFGGTVLADLPAEARQQAIALVPQRHALIGGTIAENLRLADPQANDEALLKALKAVALDKVIAEKGGLQAQLGFRGAGLSGGEGRRLALARAILRKPKILLLDEPTEGLDAPTAAAVLSGMRTSLPDAAIVIAAHKEIEVLASVRRVAVTAPL